MEILQAQHHPFPLPSLILSWALSHFHYRPSQLLLSLLAGSRCVGDGLQVRAVLSIQEVSEPGESGGLAWSGVKVIINITLNWEPLSCRISFEQ